MFEPQAFEEGLPAFIHGLASLVSESADCITDTVDSAVARKWVLGAGLWGLGAASSKAPLSPRARHPALPNPRRLLSAPDAVTVTFTIATSDGERVAALLEENWADLQDLLRLLGGTIAGVRYTLYLRVGGLWLRAPRAPRLNTCRRSAVLAQQCTLSVLPRSACRACLSTWLPCSPRQSRPPP